jgi:lysophospholipase L1-like esterase
MEYLGPALTGAGIGPAPGLGNFSPAMMPRAAAALKRVVGGAGDARVLFIGDSVVFGAWAGDGPTAIDNAHANAIPALLAAAFEKYAHASIDNRGGDNGAGTMANLIASDPTISTSAWTVAVGSTAGGFILQSTVNGGTATITPPMEWDRFTAWHIRAFDGSAQNVGDLKLEATGATPVTAIGKTGAGEAVEPVVITRSTPALGAVTMTSLVDPGETTYVNAYLFENTKRSTVHMVNLGIRAANTGTGNATPLGWNRVGGGQPWIVRNAIQGIWKPDLSFIYLGINDFRLGGRNPGVSTFKTDMQSIIDACRISGDVVLIAPNDVSDADEGPVNSALYARAVIELAETNGLPWVNLRTVLGDWPAASAAGLMKDGLHPSPAGYRKIANSLLPLLTGLAQAPVALDQRRYGTASTYVLSMADHGTPLDLASANDITLTLPNNLPAGFSTLVTQAGAGKVVRSLASGATLRNRSGHTRTAGQWAQVSLEVRSNSDGASAEYVLSGDTAA